MQNINQKLGNLEYPKEVRFVGKIMADTKSLHSTLFLLYELDTPDTDTCSIRVNDTSAKHSSSKAGLTRSLTEPCKKAPVKGI